MRLETDSDSDNHVNLVIITNNTIISNITIIINYVLLLVLHLQVLYVYVNKLSITITQ